MYNWNVSWSNLNCFMYMYLHLHNIIASQGKTLHARFLIHFPTNYCGIYEGGPKNNRNLNVARELELNARCAARCRESTQYSSSLQREKSRLSVIVVVAFFSKCLLGGLAIFMMADNKEQRVCVKFCFLFGTVRNSTSSCSSDMCESFLTC
jgi:hypothetical protein